MTSRIAVALVALWGCKDREPASPAPGSGSAAIGAPPAASATGAGPALPAVPDAAPSLAHTAFAKEPRNEAWATMNELELVAQLDALPGVTAECRSTQCRVVVPAKDQAGATDALALIESARGLRGHVDSILLDAPISRPDGSQNIIVYVRPR